VTRYDDEASPVTRRSKDRPGETAATIGGDDPPRGGEREQTAGHSPNGRQPVTARASPDPLRRLGLSEYILLGLIVLGIAITVAMALFNP
jgi:hypothetical protein